MQLTPLSPCTNQLPNHFDGNAGKCSSVFRFLFCVFVLFLCNSSTLSEVLSNCFSKDSGRERQRESELENTSIETECEKRTACNFFIGNRS